MQALCMGRAVRSHKGAQKMTKYIVSIEGRADREFTSRKAAVDFVRDAAKATRVYCTHTFVSHSDPETGNDVYGFDVDSSRAMLESNKPAFARVTMDSNRRAHPRRRRH